MSKNKGDKTIIWRHSFQINEKTQHAMDIVGLDAGVLEMFEGLALTTGDMINIMAKDKMLILKIGGNAWAIDGNRSFPPSRFLELDVVDICDISEDFRKNICAPRTKPH